jgi:alpha-ribazole phosphatase
MRDIYLIRHTTPAVARGICYGQTDLDITGTFLAEAAVIRQVLPAGGCIAVHSSPLKRCALLARHLFLGHPITWQDELMEVHCGEWEMKSWDTLPKEEIDPWMADFVNIPIPGGESYLDLQQRVGRCWERIRDEAKRAGAEPADTDLLPAPGAIAVVAHGGVIRSILSAVTGTPLIDSFKAFSLHYGCVVKVFPSGEQLAFTILSNQVPADKEQHKPKRFYK